MARLGPLHKYPLCHFLNCHSRQVSSTYALLGPRSGFFSELGFVVGVDADGIKLGLKAVDQSEDVKGKGFHSDCVFHIISIAPIRAKVKHLVPLF